AERNRASSTTSVYVLSPYEAFFGLLWEADVTRHGKSAHDLRQEIDLGFPHRFEIGFENEFGVIGSDAHETAGTIELRYALANWNVLPLNPALSAEYIFGFGGSVHSALEKHHSGMAVPDQPDAVALRILLGQDFAQRFG